MTRTIRALLVALFVLLGTVLPLQPARAAEGDRITKLDVTYAINPDGSVDVDYKVDYHFGSADRHGISFSIATGQVRPDNLAKVTQYGVGDVMVTDAQGNSIPFTSSDSRNFLTEASSRDLRIGDPDRTIEGTEASYRIRWHGTGMLRTTNGLPNLDWVVTSTHMPPIDAWTVTVNAPAPVSRPLCSGSCTGRALPKGYVFQGAQLPADTQLTIGVDLPKGSVANATPVLVDRDLYGAVSVQGRTTWTVAKDGSMAVAEEHTMVAGREKNPIYYRVPVRKGKDELRDRVMPVEGFTATWDGTPLPVEAHSDEDRDDSYESREYRIFLPQGSGVHTLRIGYTVRNLVDVSYGAATISWPTKLVSADDRSLQLLVVDLPGPAKDADCAADTITDPRLLPEGKQGLRGNRVSCLSSGRDMSYSQYISLDPTSVPDIHELLEPSRSHAREVREQRALGTGVGAALLATLVPWLGRLRRRRHQRYADTPVGVVDRSAREVADDTPTVPVRFSPPEVGLTEAGALLQLPPPRVLAAVMARMALAGSLYVTHPPLNVNRVGKRAPTDRLEAGIWRQADKPSKSAKTTPKTVTAMANEVERAMAREANTLFQKGSTDFTGRRTLWVFGVGLAVLLVGGAVVARLCGWTPAFAAVGLGGLVALGSMLWAVSRPVPGTRTGYGTAVHDQVEGYRSYLATAEADQLRFEEGTDAFADGLPWAILFGLADRWARVCQQAADEGRAPAVDVDRFTSVAAWSASTSFDRDLARSSNWSADSSSSSSSGGSSGGGSSWSSSSSSSDSSSSSGGGVSIDSW